MRKEQVHLENQIDRVLQMAMADADNFELEIEQIDLLELVQKTLTSMKLMVSMKSGQISLQPDMGVFIVQGDATHLSNVFYNLIDNALKYCNTTPAIDIKLSKIRDRVHISIQDNGVGISSEMQKTVFEKFYRVHQEEGLNAQGFGLGLSYVKRLINLHKGEITLNSVPGEGSIFELNLPGT
jgi:two-component system phosphate regulon sensor histidine kinase PhoR